jgi:hypothetical protein
MPETQEIVINTGPIIALVAAMGDLSVLTIYRKVWAPLEVGLEIGAGGAAQFALAEFNAASWLQKSEQPIRIAADLLNTLMTDIALRVEHLSQLYTIGARQQRHDTTSASFSAGLRDAIVDFRQRAP